MYPASDHDPMAMEIAALDTDMRETLYPIYTMAQRSLEVVNWFGYNDHGPRHIDHVTARTVQALQAAHADTDTVRRGIVAARGHDLGNLLSRDIHSLISPELLLKVYPRLADHPEDWAIIQQAIEFHDTEVYKELMREIDGMDCPDKIQMIRTILSPEALALIIGDKTDLGKHRVNRKARYADAIETHVHSRMDLFMTTTQAGKQDDGTFLWEILYDPTIDLDQYPEYAELAELGEGTVRAIRPSYGYEDIKSKIFQNHLGRIELTMLSAFALYEDLKDYQLRFVDSTTGAIEVVHITPDTFNQTVTELRQRHVHHSK